MQSCSIAVVQGVLHDIAAGYSIAAGTGCSIAAMVLLLRQVQGSIAVGAGCSIAAGTRVFYCGKCRKFYCGRYRVFLLRQVQGVLLRQVQGVLLRQVQGVLLRQVQGVLLRQVQGVLLRQVQGVLLWQVQICAIAAFTMYSQWSRYNVVTEAINVSTYASKMRNRRSNTK